MNRKEIREAIFDETDWAPDESQEAVDRVNGFINRAYQQLSLEAPFLVFESQHKLFTQEDAVPFDDGDTVELISNDPSHVLPVENPWVFRTTRIVGDASATPWKVDRSWDGRMIDITDADGTIHQNVIQSVWEQVLDGDTYVLFSVQKPWPWPELGTGPFKWRVYTRDYYLPDDVIEVRGAKVRSPDTIYDDIKIVDQADAERRGMVDDSGTMGAGLPQYMFRRSHMQIPSLNTAPQNIVNALYDELETFEWVGPEPVGSFEYCVTLAWGKRDYSQTSPGVPFWATAGAAYEESSAETQTVYTEWAKNRVREPLFESAPSPVVAAEVEPPPELNMPIPAILLAMPNIEYMLGTMLTGTSNNAAFRRINASHSGWHIRIYRRRLTADFTNYSGFGQKTVGAAITGLRRMDIKDDFFLLAEMRVDEFNEGVFIDNGTIIPDYRRPLRDIHGYAGVRLWPAPDARYEVELRVVQRPTKLASDHDVPRLQPEAIQLLINKTLITVYQHLRDPQSSAKASMEYDAMLKTLKNRYGSLRPQNQPRYRGVARAVRQPYYVMSIPRS